MWTAVADPRPSQDRIPNTASTVQSTTAHLEPIANDLRMFVRRCIFAIWKEISSRQSSNEEGATLHTADHGSRGVAVLHRSLDKSTLQQG